MIKHNFNQAADALSRQLKKSIKKIDASAAEIVLTGYNMLVDRSPVDTGRFRASHLMTLNTETDATAPAGSTQTAYTAQIQKNKLSASSKLSSFSLQKAKKIVIQNNLEYAQAIENGHSDQAPRGVYKIVWKIMQGAIR